MQSGGYLTYGTVARVVPAFHTYEVLVDSGARHVFATELTPAGSLPYGTKHSFAYPPGTRVLVFVPIPVVSSARIGIILGAARTLSVSDKSPSVTNTLLNASIDVLKASVNDTRLVPENTPMEWDMSWGKASDILPGEYAVSNYFGGGLFVSDFLTFLGSSESCRIEFNILDDLVRIYGKTLQERISACERSLFTDGGMFSEVTRISASINEFLGGYGTTPALSEQPYTFSSPSLYKRTGTPSFSAMTVSGHLADGSLDMRLARSGNRTIGVMSERKGTTGEYVLRAARSISFEKTLVIPVPLSVDDPDVVQKDLDEFSETFFVTDPSFFGASGAYVERDHDVESRELARFRRRKKVWSTPEKKTDIVTGSDEPSLQPLPLSEPFQQSAPSSVEIDGVPGEDGSREEKAELLNITSMIRQLPDGSIVISGGYGEEIRLYRGNIYMTCPGDIIRTPGRDDVAIAGNCAVLKAATGSAELEGKSVNVVSDGNLQIVSAASGKDGTLIVESRSAKGLDMSEYDQNAREGTGYGGGILLKGKDLTMLSDAVRIEGENFDRSTLDVRSGNITSVYRNSVDYVQGGRRAVISKEFALLMGASSVEIVAQSVGLNSSNVRIHPGKINNVAFVDQFGLSGNRTFSFSRTSLYVKGDVVSTSVKTPSLSAISVDEGSGPTAEDIEQTLGDTPPGTSLESENSFRVMEPLDEKALREDPKTWGAVMSTSRYSFLSLPVARWQKMLSGGAKWSPVRMKKSFGDYGEESTYPGIANLERYGSLKRLGQDGSVSNEKLAESYTLGISE